MMLLAPTDTPKFRHAHQCHPNLFGWFLTPRKRGIPGTLTETPAKFGIDNDCFAGNFNLQQYAEWLETLRPWTHRSLFAPTPDTLADWPATLRQFWWSHAIIKASGHPVAIVLQDGATPETIPWHKIDAVFVGGTTHWKLSQHVIRILITAKAKGKWRHIGRVNSQKRIRHFWRHADSFDGSFVAKSPDQALRRLGSQMLQLQNTNRLFDPVSTLPSPGGNQWPSP